MWGDGKTRWTITTRRYYQVDADGSAGIVGLAQKVRAERRDHVSWTRILEAIWWWPVIEGPHWPAQLISAPEWGGSGPEPDAWANFEVVTQLTGRSRWDELKNVRADSD